MKNVILATVRVYSCSPASCVSFSSYVGVLSLLPQFRNTDVTVSFELGLFRCLDTVRCHMYTYDCLRVCLLVDVCRNLHIYIYIHIHTHTNICIFICMRVLKQNTSVIPVHALLASFFWFSQHDVCSNGHVISRFYAVILYKFEYASIFQHHLSSITFVVYIAVCTLSGSCVGTGC